MAAARPEYPSRPKFFAYRFCRVLAKACVANDLGAGVCWLLTVVAHTEDAKGYRSPVTFFNEQLVPLVGAKNVQALDRIRAKAVAAGWLVYRAGRKGKAGQYWVEIPAAHRDWDDAPTDEPAPGEPAAWADYSWLKSTTKAGLKRDESEEETGMQPGCNRDASDQHSSLLLSLPLSQDPPNPPGGGGDAVGPRPEEVREEWNRHPGLTPCGEMNPHRERVVRSWAVGNPAWVSHWRAAIAFVGRTADYTGGMSSGWRADLTWFLKAENFTRVVERMLAPPAPPGTGPPADRREAERRAIIEAAKRKAG